jgi:hypothetical protein
MYCTTNKENDDGTKDHIKENKSLETDQFEVVIHKNNQISIEKINTTQQYK